MRAGFYGGPRLYAAARMRARRVHGVRAPRLVMARVHTSFMLRCPREWPSSACVCVCLVSQVGTLRQEKRDTELGGLARPSAIINYLQVLQNNNTKKCEPSISPPFTRNQYQYLMQCG